MSRRTQTGERPGWNGVKIGVLANALRSEMHALIDKLDPLGRPDDDDNGLIRLQILAALEQFPGMASTEKEPSA